MTLVRVVLEAFSCRLVNFGSCMIYKVKLLYILESNPLVCLPQVIFGNNSEGI